jgi:DNA-binding SARP family transcriptional activator
MDTAHQMSRQNGQSTPSGSIPDMTEELQVYALGTLRVFRHRTPLRFPTQKSQDLLCLLLLRAGQALERDLIAEYLWPMHSSSNGRRCLSTALWRLRQVLEAEPKPVQPYILTEHSTLTFNTATSYWLDVEVFESKSAFGLAGPLPCAADRRQALEEAVRLYSGDLLAGCYDDWCLAQRERLRLLLLQALKQLQCDYHYSKDFELAIACGQRLLSLDMLQEDVHRELIRCYVDAGQRPQALQQFQYCRETLHRELHIDPMPETWALYRQIRRAMGAGPLGEATEASSVTLREALGQLRQALAALESAWDDVQQASSGYLEGRSSDQPPQNLRIPH